MSEQGEAAPQRRGTKRSYLEPLPAVAETLDTVIAETPMYTSNTGRNVTIAEIVQLRQQGAWSHLRATMTRIAPPGIPGMPHFPPLRITDISGHSSILAELIRIGAPTVPELDREMLPACYEVTSNPMPEYEDALSALWEMLEGPTAADGYERLFPYGYPNFADRRQVPSYRQNLVNVQGWPLMYTTTQVLARHYNATMQVEHRDATISLLNQLRDCMQTHVFGAGSHLGQLGRIATGLAAKQATMPGGSHDGTQLRLYRAYHRFEAAMERVDPWRPTSEYRFNFKVGDLLALEDFVVQLSTGQQLAPISVNATADSGFPYCLRSTNPIKGVSLFSDILIATQMQKDADSVVAKTMGLADFENKWSWLGLVKTKAKAEVYHVDKLTTRTRNIFPVDSCLNYVLMCFMAAFKGDRAPAEPHASLRGFAPFGGGLEAVVASIVRDCHTSGHAIRYYADNIYLYRQLGDELGDIVGVSIDAAQMEATHDAGLSVNLMRYLIHRLNGEDPGPVLEEPAGCTVIPAGTAFLCQWLASRLCDNWIGVLETVQFYGFGIPSGLRTTFETNHMKTTLLVNEMIERGIPAEGALTANGEITQRMVKCLKDMGYPAKIELETNHTKTGEGFAALLHHPYTLTEIGKECRIDMLGFDAVAIRIPEADINVVIAVLSRERLVKSMSFRKSRIAKRYTELTDLQISLMDYMTMAALYLIGGWRPPYCYGFFATMTAISTEIKRYATGMTAESMRATAELLWDQTAMAMDDTIDQETAEALRGRVTAWIMGIVPSLADVLELCHSPAVAARMATLLAAQQEKTIFSGGEATGYATLTPTDRGSVVEPPAKRQRAWRTP